MYLIPLKLKYRNPDHAIRRENFYKDPDDGTRLFRAAKNRPNPGMPGNGRGTTKQKKKLTQGYGVRRKAYGPW